MDEDTWHKYYLKEFCFDDPSDPLLKAKPVPMLWSYYFISSMKIDRQRGFDFSKKCVTIIYQILEESLTTLQDLVLKGDIATTEYQIQRQIAQAPNEGEEKKLLHEQDKSVLHYAVLSGNVPMVQMLLSAGYLPELNAPDLITAFTPLHMAIFIENKDMLWTLISHGAKPDIMDAYRGTALDYARITQLMPYKYQKHLDSTHINVFDPESNKIEAWSVKQFENKFKVTWCAEWIAGNDYIEELLFGGFSIGNPDMEFRQVEESHASSVLTDYVGPNICLQSMLLVGTRTLCLQRSVRKWGGALMQHVTSKREISSSNMPVRWYSRRELKIDRTACSLVSKGSF